LTRPQLAVIGYRRALPHEKFDEDLRA